MTVAAGRRSSEAQIPGFHFPASVYRMRKAGNTMEKAVKAPDLTESLYGHSADIQGNPKGSLYGHSTDIQGNPEGSLYGRSANSEGKEIGNAWNVSGAHRPCRGEQGKI